MGMAASQARLLTLTARLSDNELRSQTINNAKMRLATQSSQASEAYINALNNATLKFTNYDETGATLTQPLTYNSLMAYSSYNTQYGLVNSSGQILVSEAEAKMFKDANGDLNKYLKAHGLEYTTTYFKEAGGIENSDYPAPFNNVSSDTLQQWYEEYGSYENSVEVENYNKAYSNYNSTRNTLTHALSGTLNLYFGGNEKGEGCGFQNNLNWNNNDYLKYLKYAYSYSSKSHFKYNIYNSTTQKFVDGLGDTTSGAGKAINDLLKNYTHDGTNLTIKSSEEIKATENTTLDLDGYAITIDGEGRVTQVEYKDDGKITYNGAETIFSESSPTWIPPTVSVTDADGNTTQKGPSLNDFLRNFTINEETTDDNGNVIQVGTTGFSLSGKNLTTTKTISNPNAQLGEINNLNEKLLTILRENTDYSKFSELLIKDKNKPNNQKLFAGITIPDSVDKYVKDCIDYKNAFIETIFKDTTTTQYKFPNTDNTSLSDPMTIEEAIDNGIVKMNSLTNEEFVLWLAKNSKDASGAALTQETSFMSENFKTVIKSYIIENTLIAKYGTPKYAWVDEMDTQNTGNADSKAQWYTNLYKRMEKGYKTLENGLASSQQWIEYALETGLLTMEQVDKSYNWQSLEYKTCTRITEVTDDEAVAKAEAEYNRAMNDIKTKDNMYDIQLKNIDTEHTSLQTEYDSIKQVITKNIDRTFKFDQSA